MKPFDLASVVAEVAEDRKATDVMVLDMGKVTLVADYFVICSVKTAVQARAVSDMICDRLKERGVKVGHVEGYDSGGWILLDFGPVIVHVFVEGEREFYGLERLWVEAGVVEWAGVSP